MNNNKLIAEFMGLVVSDRDNYTSELHTNVDADLKYHTSWDWLMPVVQKCFDTQEPTEGQHYFINESLLTMDIEVVCDRVVEFIKAHKKYPFNEGDDYWYECDGMILYGGCWDDISEELHDQNPNRKYFSEDEVLDVARANGIEYRINK